MATQSKIKIKKSNEGKFTNWVKRNMPGKSVCSAARAVRRRKSKYSSSVVKMATFADNFGCKTK